MSDQPPLQSCRFRGARAPGGEEFFECASACINQPIVHAENCRSCDFTNAVCEPPHETPTRAATDFLSQLAEELAAADALAAQRIRGVACRHRSARPIRVGACDQCGRKGQPFEVFQCALHGECSPRKHNKRIRACAHCDDFAERRDTGGQTATTRSDVAGS